MTLTTDTPHIVLVEDSDDDFDTVLEAVHMSGLPAKLRRVNNRDERLVLLRRGGAERPAFVMMDPDTASSDGREALRQIKVDLLLKAIPGVVVTTSANPRDLDHCDQCGANAHPGKPVSYPDHLQMLTRRFDDWLVRVLKPTAQRLAS